ncbi:hypothetical protein CHS0354_020078 [Potamilus streckersoni]|uniref:Uncharacterized protein n=1 Tax=Potamilus streckersoni TaxID=2493646 RepID=A0AAE0VU36_9BIVA|nr:hypothetical protein CHS0354_020078 [Potamilus streckersoni]
MFSFSSNGRRPQSPTIPFLLYFQQWKKAPKPNHSLSPLLSAMEEGPKAQPFPFYFIISNGRRPQSLTIPILLYCQQWKKAPKPNHSLSPLLSVMEEGPKAQPFPFSFIVSNGRRPQSPTIPFLLYCQQWKKAPRPNYSHSPLLSAMEEGLKAQPFPFSFIVSNGRRPQSLTIPILLYCQQWKKAPKPNHSHFPLLSVMEEGPKVQPFPFFFIVSNGRRPQSPTIPILLYCQQWKKAPKPKHSLSPLLSVMEEGPKAQPFPFSFIVSNGRRPQSPTIPFLLYCQQWKKAPKPNYSHSPLLSAMEEGLKAQPFPFSFPICIYDNI